MLDVYVFFVVYHFVMVRCVEETASVIALGALCVGMTKNMVVNVLYVRMREEGNKRYMSCLILFFKNKLFPTPTDLTS